MATARWFLKLDGIPGESLDAAHKDEIDVEAYSFGVSQSSSSSSAGGGARAGKAAFQDFHFVTKISKASPKLMVACASGTHIKEATLSGTRGAAKAKSDFVVYKMRDVLITSVQQAGGQDELPTEQLSLNYSKIEVNYFPQSAAGKVEPPVTAAFDLKANKKV